MKKFFTLRSFLSWLILLIAMSALAAGIKEGVLNVQDTAFFPVAAFAVTLAYVLGFSTRSTRRVWTILLLSGLLIAFIETAKLVEPIQIIIQSIPKFELGVIRYLIEHIRWFFEKENIEIQFPDTVAFQSQFAEIKLRASAFVSLILNASIKQPSVREFIWDLPLLLLAAWAGWGTSRRNQILFAVAPALVLHTYILQYTGRDLISLLVAVFALILLLGVNQKWNIVAVSSSKPVVETYSVILILSIALTVTAGLMPSISIKEITQEITKKDGLGNTLGLNKVAPKAHVLTIPVGLPRDHLIGLSPELSQTVVFTVKTGEIEPSEDLIIDEAVPRHYWRWLTYDIYNGKGWSSSLTENNSYSANEALFPIPGGSYKVIHQQVEKNSALDNRLYWTGSLARASQPFDVNWRTSPASLSPDAAPILNADMLGVTIEKQGYQADSIVPIVSANQLRDSSQTYPQEIRTKYLTIPVSTPQRVLDLAQQLTTDITNPYDKAKAIETYLRTYPYSLNVTTPPPGRDVADYFLFDLKKGYCDYYATSMIVLARAAGLPARLVIGYANGIYNPTKAEYIVREANAHSWVEVYFAGTGWVEFEPTASQPPITLPEELQKEVSPPIASFPTTFKLGVSGSAKQGYSIKHDIPSLVVLLMFIISLTGLWFLRTQGLLKAHKSIGSIYEYVYYHGKKIYKDAPLHETPSIFADKLRSRFRTGYPFLIPAPDEIKLLTDLYIQEIYSAHPITKDERTIAVKVWRKLFWRLLYARFVITRL